jgi:AsmA-like protein
MLLSRKRRWMVAAAVIVLLLFLLRPGASRLKSRIAGSITAAVQRRVEIGDVHIRLLPRPGFDLDNVMVYDDPSFGAEPMLRASEVTADLRLISLFHGRLEIARLDLTEPSLNLVHGVNGRWNLEALLERSARSSLAPTGKAGAEIRPGFPYIEGSSGRINFKIGQEKKAYALTNADFALWQDSENAWGMRLKAQPFRSDMNLSDTGTLRVDGTWQRAASVHEIPLQFSLEWNRPQLGQLTKLLTGADKGWRGTVQFQATLTGLPAQLQLSADAFIQDFRRYDITSGDPLRLTAHCDSQYSAADHEFHQLFCHGPVGAGYVTLHGDLGLPGSHRYDLDLMAQNVPAGSLAALAERAKKSIPEDLTAEGALAGSLAIRRNGPGNQMQLLGSGEIAGLRLASASNKAEFEPVSVPFVMTSGRLPTIAESSKPRRTSEDPAVPNGGPFLEFGPFPVAMGRASAPTVQGWINFSGYNVSLKGEVEVARAMRVARLFGIPALTAAVEGTAQADLQLAGLWTGWASPSASPPRFNGTARLRNVRVNVRGTDGPLEINSADLQLLPDAVRLARLNASAAHALWTGSLELLRGCGTPSDCAVHFSLSTNETRLGELAQWVHPQPRKQPWYRILTPETQKSDTTLFASVHASGYVVANRFWIRSLPATRVSANVTLSDGKLRASDLRTDFLGGTHRGEWELDFRARPTVYTGRGSLNGISLARLANTMDDPGISGLASGSYEIKASETPSKNFWQSAEGSLQMEMRDGVLPHVSLENDGGPIRVNRLQAQMLLHDGKLEIKRAELQSKGTEFEVSGTASLDRELDLRLARSPMINTVGSEARGYTITGTVAEPKVVPVSSFETKAELKP